jgi:hypothetical protein
MPAGSTCRGARARVDPPAVRLLRPLLAPVLLASACASPPPASAPLAETPPPPRCVPAPSQKALDTFVVQNRARQKTAIARAREFLDSLDVDPIKLRAMRIKGKKKLVEALDAYYHLWLVAPPDDKTKILARVESLARPTREDRYHDMRTIDDREFKEDATSYLRAALLLDRMGVDIARYREEIKSVHWRLDSHMKERGTHQRRAFHTYYLHFGLTEPFPLEGALEKGLIASRADPDKLSKADVYALTHEVYAAYAFGDELDADPFNDADRGYLRAALPKLVGIWQGKKDPDLVAELVTCLRYARFTGDPAYTEGLAYLLGSQNADGAWGDYESARKRFGDLVRQGFYLHTTMVVIEALLLGFEDAYRKGEWPVCG